MSPRRRIQCQRVLPRVEEARAHASRGVAGRGQGARAFRAERTVHMRKDPTKDVHPDPTGLAPSLRLQYSEVCVLVGARAGAFN